MPNPRTDPFWFGDPCAPLSAYTPSEFKPFPCCCAEDGADASDETLSELASALDCLKDTVSSCLESMVDTEEYEVCYTDNLGLSGRGVRVSQYEKKTGNKVNSWIEDKNGTIITGASCIDCSDTIECESDFTDGYCVDIEPGETETITFAAPVSNVSFGSNDGALQVLATTTSPTSGNNTQFTLPGGVGGFSFKSNYISSLDITNLESDCDVKVVVNGVYSDNH